MSRAMKDSGVEWIGEIPADWEICRLKNYAQIQNGQDYKVVLDDEGTYPVIGSGGAFARANSFLYAKESVLLGRKGTVDKPLYMKYPFWTVDTMYYTVINNDVCGKYFYYLCTQIEFQYYQYGSAVPSMTQRDLNNIYFPQPSFQMQHRIASYLDTKCGKIDAIIDREQAVIAKLKEYKQSLITEVVTKGLDPEVPMKDSGVDWIGQIPATWEVTQISHLFNLKAGGDVKKEFFSYDYDVRHPYPVYTNTTQKNQVYGYTEKPFFEKNTITVTGRGFIGYAVYRENSYDAIIRLLVLSPKNKKNCKYYMYCINSIPSFTVESSAIGQLSTQQMAPFMVCVPSLSEQQQIVAYLDTKCAKIDATIARKQALIEKLGEYKKSLIYEVVTGKKEVG